MNCYIAQRTLKMNVFILTLQVRRGGGVAGGRRRGRGAVHVRGGARGAAAAPRHARRPGRRAAARAARRARARRTSVPLPLLLLLSLPRPKYCYILLIFRYILSNIMSKTVFINKPE